MADCVLVDFVTLKGINGKGYTCCMIIVIFFLYSKRDNYILIKQPHQEGGAERKFEYNGSLKKENTKVKWDLIS